MTTRFATACSALTAVALAAAAGIPSPARPAAPGAVGTESATAAHPVTERTPGRAPATPECQNPLASLRPQGSLPVPGQMPPGSTMDRIFKQGHLTVGVLEDTPPMASRDVTTLQLVGFDIDIARDIAQAIFGDRDKVLFRPLPEYSRLEVVTKDQDDLVIAAITINCERRALVDFSTVYYEAAQQVLINRDSTVTSLDDLGGKRVCAPRDSTPLMKVQTATSKPIPVSTDTNTDCLMLLQLGKVDALFSDDAILAGLAKQDSSTKIVGTRVKSEPYGVAINKNSPDLVRFVNAVLARRIEDGRWRTSYYNWLEPQLGPPPALPTPQYRD